MFTNLRNLDLQGDKHPSNDKQEFSCFEKCLGKFTDSYEHALNVMSGHIDKNTEETVFQHKEGDEKKYIMGDEGSIEPVYDKPSFRKKK
eukprot:403364221